MQRRLIVRARTNDHRHGGEVGRVLLIEDECGVRETIRGTLQRHGVGVDVVATFDEAEGAIRSRPYDAVLIDIWLDGRNGLELVPFVRRYQPRAEKFAVSGDDEMLEAATAAGASFLLKPALTEALLHIAETVRARTGTFARPPRERREPLVILALCAERDLLARLGERLADLGVAAELVSADALDAEAKDLLLAAKVEAVLIDDASASAQRAIDSIRWMQQNELRIPVVVRAEARERDRPKTIGTAVYWRARRDAAEELTEDVLDALWVMAQKRADAEDITSLLGERFELTAEDREVLELIARGHPQAHALPALRPLEKAGHKARIVRLRARLGIPRHASLESVIDAARVELIHRPSVRPR